MWLQRAIRMRCAFDLMTLVAQQSPLHTLLEAHRRHGCCMPPIAGRTDLYQPTLITASRGERWSADSHEASPTVSLPQADERFRITPTAAGFGPHSQCDPPGHLPAIHKADFLQNAVGAEGAVADYVRCSGYSDRSRAFRFRCRSSLRSRSHHRPRCQGIEQCSRSSNGRARAAPHAGFPSGGRSALPSCDVYAELGISGVMPSFGLCRDICE